MASTDNVNMHFVMILILCALSPATGVSDDGPTVAVIAGFVGSTAANIGADDGGIMVEEVGSVVAVVESSNSVAAAGAAEGITASGVVVASATTVGTDVLPTGWIAGAGDVTKDVGLGDERAVVGDRAGAGKCIRGSA